MKLLIKNARIIDPACKIDEIGDILIEDGKIAQIAPGVTVRAGSVIDATGKIVMPGIIDMHVHLREPGREDKETISSATMAGIKGGITSLLAMPNTQPVIDSVEHARLLRKIIGESAHSDVLVAGAVTKGRLGKELVDIASLRKEGVLVISDDGASVDSDELMSQALQDAKKQGILVACHCEDRSLSNNGVVNLGLTSTAMGLRGISNASEYKRIQRDIDLAQEANCPIHITHVSCRESVEIIAAAKKKGIKITADTAPHYFALSEEAVRGYDTNMKMNPPLRSKVDVKAIKEGLKDGTIDAIASDHAPHTENEKDIEFDRAEFGVIGLETLLAVSISTLIAEGWLSWPQLVAKIALNPARILGINKGSLRTGADADLIIVSPDQQWQVKKQEFVSKSKNSPFIGRTLKGLVDYTVLSGQVVYRGKMVG